MLKIGQLATLAAVSRDTLRFYERHGLVTPNHRNDAGYRLYSASDVHRISFILSKACYGGDEPATHCTILGALSEQNRE